jgi:hypothetical protein
MYQIKTRYISQNAITLRVADGLYVDAVFDSTNYIASWNIIGNSANPGNVTIVATAITQASYPPHASIARSCISYSMANITINGFTFQSYYENAGSNGGGNLTIYNCAFTAPTSGNATPITSNVSGKCGLYGNCSYSGAVAAICIFSAYDAGSMILGYNDAISTNNLVFNINGTPTITSATALATGVGNIIVHNAAVSFTGGIPACRQFIASAAGGISFSTGVTTVFPGTQPGLVSSPGWTS